MKNISRKLKVYLGLAVFCLLGILVSLILDLNKFNSGWVTAMMLLFIVASFILSNLIIRQRRIEKAGFKPAKHKGRLSFLVMAWLVILIAAGVVMLQLFWLNNNSFIVLIMIFPLLLIALVMAEILVRYHAWRLEVEDEEAEFTGNEEIKNPLKARQVALVHQVLGYTYFVIGYAIFLLPIFHLIVYRDFFDASHFPSSAFIYLICFVLGLLWQVWRMWRKGTFPKIKIGKKELLMGLALLMASGIGFVAYVQYYVPYAAQRDYQQIRGLSVMPADKAQASYVEAGRTYYVIPYLKSRKLPNFMQEYAKTPPAVGRRVLKQASIGQSDVRLLTWVNKGQLTNTYDLTYALYGTKRLQTLSEVMELMKVNSLKQLLYSTKDDKDYVTTTSYGQADTIKLVGQIMLASAGKTNVEYHNYQMRDRELQLRPSQADYEIVLYVHDLGNNHYALTYDDGQEWRGWKISSEFADLLNKKY